MVHMHALQVNAGDASVIVTATRHACAVPCMAACDILVQIYGENEAVRT